VEKDLLHPFRSLDDLLSRINELGYLPEGAVACRHVAAIVAERKLELPIMGGVHAILDRKIEPIEFLERYLHSMGARRSAAGTAIRAAARKLRDEAGAATEKIRRRGASTKKAPRAPAEKKPKPRSGTKRRAKDGH
jgi:hypothetical protein